MGSMSRLSAIEKVISAFKNEILYYFGDIVGMTIGEIKEEDVDVEYWIGAFVSLTGLSKWEGVYVHFGWGTEEGVNSGEEIDRDSVAEFNEFFAGNKIISISLDEIERDDEIYLFAKIDEYSSLEILLGFNPETSKFTGFLQGILTEEQRKYFTENYGTAIHFHK